MRHALLCLGLGIGSAAFAQPAPETPVDAGMIVDEVPDEGAPPELDAGTPAEESYESAAPMEDLTSGNANSGPASAAPSELAGTIKSEPTHGFGGGNEVNGYLDSRSQFARSNVFGLIPTNDLPQLDELIEANVQLKHTYAPRGFFYADVSIFGQFAGNYRGLDPDGNETLVANHAVSTVVPLVSVNELYLSQDFGSKLNVLVGKKRIVWGPGFSFNPTDLINPPKDPTDPTFQRAGAWMARVEENLGNLAFTLLGTPGVTEQANGVPYAFVTYPSWDAAGDGQYHYLLAARAYALVANADLNLMLYYSNRYNDVFEHKVRVGASFSRYFFTDYEVHAEALFQQGSTRLYPNPSCDADALAGFLCGRYQTALLTDSRLNDTALLPKVLAGARRQFDDESLLTLEYYFQADGLSRNEFQAYVDLLENSKANRQIYPSIVQFQANATTAGIPQKFTFDPIGRHYLIINYSKPKIANDWTAAIVVIANLTDLSTLLAPSISWSTTEWLTLSFNAFIPTPGPKALAATTSTGGYYGEYSLIPDRYRLLFEARIFY